MLARETARIDFHAGLEVVRECKMASDKFSKPADFIGSQECWRAAAPMKLHNFPARIKQGAHPGHFFLKIINIGLALAVIQRDNGRATAKPAQRFTKRNVEIQRE